MRIQLRHLKNEWDSQLEKWRIYLSVLLFSDEGIPCVNKDVIIKIDGKIVTTITTDETGEAVTDYILIPNDVCGVHADAFVFDSKGVFAGNNALYLDIPVEKKAHPKKNGSTDVKKGHKIHSLALDEKVRVIKKITNRVVDGENAVRMILLRLYRFNDATHLWEGIFLDVYLHDKLIDSLVLHNDQQISYVVTVAVDDVLANGVFHGFISKWYGEKPVTRDDFERAEENKKLRAYYELTRKIVFRFRDNGQEFPVEVSFKHEDPKFHSSPKWLIG